jgi:hypothetical protein
VTSTAIGRLGSIPRSVAQTRILVATLDLFGDHGVSGTSLQMIADAIGVTKAAVYHQSAGKGSIAQPGDRDGRRSAPDGGCHVVGSRHHSIPRRAQAVSGFSRAALRRADR